MLLLKKAIRFAIKAHKGQMYRNVPYSQHLSNVTELTEYYNLPWEVQIAAWLHDTLEDTKTIYSDLEKEFGYNIAQLVYLVTDEPGENRRERHLKTYPKTRNNPLAVALKLCDRLANVGDAKLYRPDLFKMYKKEYKEFKKALYIENEWPKLWSELDNLLGV